MQMRLLPIALIATASLTVGSARADDPAGDVPGPSAKIQWFGTWASAKAEAKRTGRPILLTSAAPQCKGTPGIW